MNTHAVEFKSHLVIYLNLIQVVVFL